MRRVAFLYLQRAVKIARLMLHISFLSTQHISPCHSVCTCQAPLFSTIVVTVIKKQRLPISFHKINTRKSAILIRTITHQGSMASCPFTTTWLFSSYDVLIRRSLSATFQRLSGRVQSSGFGSELNLCDASHKFVMKPEGQKVMRRIA